MKAFFFISDTCYFYGLIYTMKYSRLFLLLFVGTALCCLSACNSKPALFKKISADHSGISFNNKIVENDSINPIDLVNIYNGGGIGFGDFNNDGLQDIYLTGNQVSSKLYLNKGNFVFEDITGTAGVEGMGRWARGVAIVDINNDGLMDMYVCNTIYKDSLRRRNILYVNLGADKQGVPHFKDMAGEYGLTCGAESTMANFFDYDNDGDLDMYLVVNAASSENENKFGKGTGGKIKDNKGRLYRNDWDSSLQHGVFHDISMESGIMQHGYGHGATITDINLDGWKDIYVSDDFISDNILYINNHNGTFTDRSKDYFKHTSFNAMGQDVIDINNDGLSDVVELDMNPQDNYRKKMMMGSNNYNTYQNFENFQHQFQYVRNTLQLNQGPRVLENDSVGPPAFSEISFLSGVAQTDWSWAPLITDFDNDGFRDMIVTNGFPRDVSDHDFIAYRRQVAGLEGHLDMLNKIPQIKLSNYAFKNTNGTIFSDVSADWGLNTPSFSNGAAYADLDNDGDMDIVVNNIDDDAFVYENTLRKKEDSSSHFLQVSCRGSRQNIHGLGAWIDIYYDGDKHQSYENTPYRGYLSTDQNIAHFGLGKTNTIDSVVVRWPEGKKQTLKNIKADQLVITDIKNATETSSWQTVEPVRPPLFKEITASAGIHYTAKDINFIDFNIQTTLPHKLSEYSPALAAGDINSDGLDDIIAGGNTNYPATVFLQQADGKFTQRALDESDIPHPYNDEGLLLFDANGDGKPDLYISSGGYRPDANSADYQDRLYMNDGKGRFTLAADALPLNHTSKLCVRAADFNKDGKLDLFVSGRVLPGKYPKPVSSFIFRNDSENGKVRFTDVTAELAPDLLNIGMVCDALFTDFDNDGQVDLILAGEWMPVTFLKNMGGKFINNTAASGLSGKTGWWNSIVAGDFRHTGSMDYIIGNTGLNTLYQASDEYPVYITAKDFDHNGSYVPVPSLFLLAPDGKMKEFPAYGRDDIAERIPTLKKRFNNYNSFANADMDQVFTPDMRKDAQRLKATMLQSCYLRNEGNGRFTMIPLPLQAQYAPLNGMVADDFDGDGNLDVLLNGNDFSTEVSIGRLDAMNGLLLKGDGRGGFKPLSMLESGIYIPGDGKALVKLKSGNGHYLVAASQHSGPLKLFELNTPVQLVPINADDITTLVHYKNGATEKKELYYGESFLSQSARQCAPGSGAVSITITNSRGISRTTELNK